MRSAAFVVPRWPALAFSCALASLSATQGLNADEAKPMTMQPQFEASWDSLTQYEVPDWFRNAKFGIFLHWGVQTVPENDGWYARHMYMQEGAEFGYAYEYHLKKFGHPSQFGLKDFIPMWTADKWDPRALTKIFKDNGARYIVPVAVHHDNFDNYASTYQAWNSVNLGPKRDVVGEWKAAAGEHGLRFGVSSHSDRSWDWFLPSRGSDVKGPLKGVPYDGNLTAAEGKGKWWDGYDPQELYPPAHQKGEEPTQAYKDNWYLRTQELIDKYQPDLLYFDSPLPLGDYGLRMASHYYNANTAWHGGKNEAVLNIKSWGPGTVPDESAIVLDIEKGQSDSLRVHPWQTDTSLLGPWFYSPDPPVYGADVVVHNLGDIVSKNGNLLLNIALRTDGTLPDDQKLILEQVGAWLDVNGEAIYDTRPWTKFGEGPSQVSNGDFNEPTKPMTAEDVRFTTKGNTLYAIIMGWPGSEMTVKSLVKGAASVSRVQLLGATYDLWWSQTDKGLTVRLPQRPAHSYAYVLKITP